MAINKERIKKLEAGLGEFQDSFSIMEIGNASKLHQMEDSIWKIFYALFSNKDAYNNNYNNRNNHFYSNREESRDNFNGG